MPKEKNWSTPGTGFKVALTFTEPLLGTLPANPEIAKEYIFAKHPCPELPADEVEAQSPLSQDDLFSKGMTVFARDEDGAPLLWDYQIKGFFKESCRAMIDTGLLTKEELKALLLTEYTYKRTIDHLIMVLPRRLRIQIPVHVVWPVLSGVSDGPNGLKIFQRPLRKENPRGGVSCLATSEIVPPDSVIDLEIIILRPALLGPVRQWLDYGFMNGLGQFRSGSFGRFSWKEV